MENRACSLHATWGNFRVSLKGKRNGEMVRPFRPGLVERLLGDLFHVVNRRIVWYRLGFLLSVVNLVALRTNLRRFNLYDTETREPEAPSSWNTRRSRHPHA